MEITQSVKILYVDDNEVNQIYVKKVLSRINVEVQSVYSGEACLEYLETHNDIILVLLDIQMPGIDGFETAKLIKKTKKDDYLPIIFISGIYNTEEFINMGFDIGAIDFIVKPISRSILKYKILAYVTIHLQNNLLKTQAQELEQSKAYLEKVLELIPYKIFKIDHNRLITNLKTGGLIDSQYHEILRRINLEIENCFMNSKQIQLETSISYDEKTYYFDVNILKLVIPNELNSVIVTLNDVTDRKERELNIQQLNRKNQILSEINFALLVAQDKAELFFAFSETLRNIAGYNTIWIGNFDHYNEENDFKINTLSISGDISKTEVERLLDSNFQGEFIEHLNELAETKHLQLIENLSECEIDAELFIAKNINTVIVIPIETEFGELFKLLLFTELKSFHSNEIDLLVDVGKLLSFGLNALWNKSESIKAAQRITFEKEELSITVKNIREGLMTVRNGGKITVANLAAEEILGYNSNELLGKNVFEITKVLESDGSESLFNPFDLIQNSESNTNVINQLTILTKDNQRKIISLNLSMISNENRSMNDLVVVFNDITEKIRIENQIALSQKMESVGQLAAGIAHEINSPMQFVGDNTYFLNDAFENIMKYISSLNSIINDRINVDNELNSEIDKIKEELDIEYLLSEIPISIDRTQTGIERVSKIVLAMKNFAHPSGKQKMFSNINHGIDVTITISKNEWKYVADLETDFDENLPNVLCIIDEINQVILNMIINSAHSIEDKLGKNPSSKGKIYISTMRIDNKIQIVIKDSGKGISKENLARIFDPFFTTKPVGKGTGQGLAIAHDIIVNKHNGSIEVEAELGIGAKFTITLPIN